ncbi:tyrosine-type recombinase/integrase [Anabaena cylindrica FACHB-243]|uniref:Integrase family protein n=1 Tax=Anabaena cylindrica (strain ATCC 27899 / PCC 7122) TaxID=272123 RepID=K9ZQ68_ANACC|nr:MULTISPECIES: tyrosine-type recombinase/integrase [Anabaena]AFZ61316.1 integrase family protein [Anabaena cylindrica PCC 7122]MBD2420175.1 tyrosine-type recombinase/integrase [Anabaena cylindrica FACHB-243]MBY5282198.1 tyrosine-type recombinase/integrase [Anabaena sp. CCAP 1446/1C]MBY5309445.1 tyrosine-type recombinase/integrase [Anabaena sp. CCAP 1446/1C]MCM2409258.1 tyrosine-type recombinase/integrase [Anabaena sp. CCAP 1446/1C]
MLINRNGQAKVLTKSEIQQLFHNGFKSSRDKALFAVAFYTACRISEARKMFIIDAFYDGKVRDEIIIRKAHSKGKQGTRSIPTHPNLKKILQEYYDNSAKLVEMKKMIGDWSEKSFNCEGKIIINLAHQCPRCQFAGIFKNGVCNNQQRYKCKKCRHEFFERELPKTDLASENSSAIEFDPLGVTCSTLYGFLLEKSDNPFLFPGRRSKGYISLRNAMSIFVYAFDKLGIDGASTHSCRRTALTMMHREGVILKVLQEISGHKDLGALQKYLEVSEEQARAAINIL